MKPMLAAAATVANIPYPVFVSPKLDGIRALIVNGKVLSRSLKPIPNRHVQKVFGQKKYNGLDGELIVGDPTAKDVFQKTSSGVMSIGGEPKVRFHVFDDFSLADYPFETRIAESIARTRKDFNLVPVFHTVVRNKEQLLQAEEKFVNGGFEGLMARVPRGLYKEGRSTLKQGWLLKLKRFTDSEAEIISVKPLMHNSNEATVNELGQKTRSSKKAGKEAREMLGAIEVQDVETQITFEIGTGFTEKQRKQLWLEDLEGRIVKYKYQKVGVKDKPRFPVFLGFRDKIDMG